MRAPPPLTVTELEIVEDLTSTSRCDEGFLHIRRLRCRNRRSDGSVSAEYRVDVVDRPRLDAVAVLVYRKGTGGIEALTRMNLRPAAHFRAEKPKAIPDDRGYLFVEEIVAGLLEPTDSGEAGVRQRAAAEVREEAGYAVSADEVAFLGAAFFAVPGILSEKIYLACVDVTGKTQLSPCGDGSPMEEGGRVRWRPLQEIIHACRSGEIPDAKTEIAAVRFLESLGESGRGR